MCAHVVSRALSIPLELYSCTLPIPRHDSFLALRISFLINLAQRIQESPESSGSSNEESRPCSQGQEKGGAISVLSVNLGRFQPSSVLATSLL